MNSIVLWNSTPIGRSINLSLCPYEQLSPQLILEDKVVRSAIHLQYTSTLHSQLQFIGTLISDDESQRLTYVIDRLLTTDPTNHEISNNHQSLTGEFLVPIQCNNQNNLIQNASQEIDVYCHSSLPIELHRFLYLCGQVYIHHSPTVSMELSFDLLTINNSFILTPINSNSIEILPTALYKNLSSSTGNNIYMNQPHFGYCSLDRMSQNKIVLTLENDPQACTLPLIGIWVSGVIDIQCAFVWAACLRYCFNSSLKQRHRSGINAQHSFLLACYSPTPYGQGIFYEVYSTCSLAIDYDLWTCSKQIPIPKQSLYQFDTQFPYDFQFKRVYQESNIDPVLENALVISPSNPNGSLFGIPRRPPKQSTHQSPSWESVVTTPITTPKRNVRSSVSTRFSSPAPSTPLVTNENEWKEEFIERMQSYETQIECLSALVRQLLANQKTISPSLKRDVAIQSEPSSPKIDNIQYQTPMINSVDRQPKLRPVSYQQETIIDYSSLHRPSANPVDILKPIFQFIDNQQQQKQQQNSSNTGLLEINDDETEQNTSNNQQQQQQQHVN